jgi:hypothetical protein
VKTLWAVTIVSVSLATLAMARPAQVRKNSTCLIDDMIFEKKV